MSIDHALTGTRNQVISNPAILPHVPGKSGRYPAPKPVAKKLTGEILVELI